MQTIIYTCDRCRKQYDAPPKVSFQFGVYDRETKQLKVKDLCPKCSDELIKWFVNKDD